MAAQRPTCDGPPSASWLTSHLVARLQAAATRLRFLLAVPAAALLFIFSDRGPIWPGAAIALAGESLQVWASAHLHKNTALIQSGPYAWVRNPMYLGRFLVGLGLVLLTWRWFFILPYIAVFCLYAQARVLGEEARLQALFGEQYQAYSRAVGRWLPRPPRAALAGGRWSWASVVRNHQLRVSVALLGWLALIWWRARALGPAPRGW